MNVKPLQLLFGTLFFISCSTKINRTPEQLATEVCDCYKLANSYSNTTKQLRKIDECGLLLQTNLAQLEQMGVDGDLSPDEVEAATKRFDNIFYKCIK